ncbi:MULTISPECIES: protein TolR [Alcaligenes]|jgi:biopolymer transport protein TolR|uniref:Protein TolR n=1 Tax=Alcaligenes aquatilis TaxID=323284 RepID=A0A3G2HXL5_9BURK|nr:MULTISPECIES: protein TolR [Alcaligenes]AWG36753.1 protein TolR [Alcaligenes aquatilis]AYN21813.1 protein TolR [Alcaligenes aquatilis]MCC9164182.1 protein TolR [Alcaligenes sp. MMA]QXR35217.1 protein TolR [Alcaligenes aquatilis]UYY86544.1 protein TolR [Alcaligenes sp. SMD-FA]
MPSMRGSTGRHGRRMKNEINVVPYIDVMLVLLVIFMVTAPMITPGLVELPSVGQASEVPAKPVEIQVDKDGKLAIRLRDAGSEFMNIEKSTLLNEVRSRMQADSPVVIAADGKVPYETVMGLMDELRSNGINRLGLIVDRNSDPDAGK